MKAITLRSGTSYEAPVEKKVPKGKEKVGEKSSEVIDVPSDDGEAAKTTPVFPMSKYDPPLPFPERVFEKKL